MHKGTFPRANRSARKRTLVHHRVETLRTEKIGALSDRNRVTRFSRLTAGHAAGHSKHIPIIRYLYETRRVKIVHLNYTDACSCQYDCLF